jgi:hypothetical protein
VFRKEALGLDKQIYRSRVEKVTSLREAVFLSFLMKKAFIT